jgi:hypothetical protein
MNGTIHFLNTKVSYTNKKNPLDEDLKRIEGNVALTYYKNPVHNL